MIKEINQYLLKSFLVWSSFIFWINAEITTECLEKPFTSNPIHSKLLKMINIFGSEPKDDGCEDKVNVILDEIIQDFENNLEYDDIEIINCVTNELKSSESRTEIRFALFKEQENDDLESKINVDKKSKITKAQKNSRVDEYFENLKIECEIKISKSKIIEDLFKNPLKHFLNENDEKDILNCVERRQSIISYLQDKTYLYYNASSFDCEKNLKSMKKSFHEIIEMIEFPLCFQEVFCQNQDNCPLLEEILKSGISKKKSSIEQNNHNLFLTRSLNSLKMCRKRRT